MYLHLNPPVTSTVRTYLVIWRKLFVRAPIRLHHFCFHRHRLANCACRIRAQHTTGSRLHFTRHCTGVLKCVGQCDIMSVYPSAVRHPAFSETPVHTCCIMRPNSVSGLIMLGGIIVTSAHTSHFSHGSDQPSATLPNSMRALPCLPPSDDLDIGRVDKLLSMYDEELGRERNMCSCPVLSSHATAEQQCEHTKADLITKQLSGQWQCRTRRVRDSIDLF